ncbi:MAG: TolC family protein [Marinilabiliales bacterium]|nr:MAG: TolC family protein [Marinilabiliales bacterium]
MMKRNSMIISDSEIGKISPGKVGYNPCLTETGPQPRQPAMAAFLAATLVLVAVFISPPLVAQVYPERYLEEALKSNPGLQAGQKAYEASLQQADIASALPDPELSAGFFTPPMERLMGNQWFDLRVMQMFPWFGTVERRRTAAHYMAEGTHHQYREQRNSLFMEMTRLWLEIYKKEQQKEVIRQSVDILKEREDIIYSRYGGGEQRGGLALDIYRMEIQIADLENRIEKIEEEKTYLVRSFNLLAGREETAAIETPEELPGISGNDIAAPPEENDFGGNPRLNMAAARAEAAEIQKDINRLMTRPMLGVGLQYSYFAPGRAAMGQMDGGHMIMPMVSVTLPVFRKKNEATRQQAVLQSEAAAFRESDQVNNLKIQWAELTAESRNIQRDHDFYLRQLEITHKAWELVLTGYAAGDEGFDELLRLLDQMVDLEWRLLEAKVDQHIKYAEMDRIHARNIFE